jgi:hypothetical protein
MVYARPHTLFELIPPRGSAGGLRLLFRAPQVRSSCASAAATSRLSEASEEKRLHGCRRLPAEERGRYRWPSISKSSNGRRLTPTPHGSAGASSGRWCWRSCSGREQLGDRSRRLRAVPEHCRGVFRAIGVRVEPRPLSVKSRHEGGGHDAGLQAR